MKTYTWEQVNRDYVEDISTEWVPADVAQRLYDIVEGERVRYELFPPENELEFMHRDAVIAALAAADGEEV